MPSLIICSGCGQQRVNFSGSAFAHCVTPGCEFQTKNLPTSKTGLSSPTKPVADPSLATEDRDLERSLGWTPALPFTLCTCWDDCGQPIQVPPHQDSCPQSPAYNPDRCDECGSIGFHKISCGHAYTAESLKGDIQYEDEPVMISGPPWPKATPGTWKGLSEAEATLKENVVQAPLATCSLCQGQFKHAESCPAKPGHSCKFCGRPIHNLEGTANWIHDDANDFTKCGKQASPKAEKLTGICTHGNPNYKGCQACDNEGGFNGSVG